jgi:hypothetical protein
MVSFKKHGKVYQCETMIIDCMKCSNCIGYRGVATPLLVKNDSHKEHHSCDKKCVKPHVDVCEHHIVKHVKRLPVSNQ